MSVCDIDPIVLVVLGLWGPICPDIVAIVESSPKVSLIRRRYGIFEVELTGPGRVNPLGPMDHAPS
jgi:hypothetical protein